TQTEKEHREQHGGEQRDTQNSADVITLLVIGATELRVKEVENCAFLRLNMTPFGQLNAGLLQAGENSLKCEDFESCGQTQPPPPDFIFGGIPRRHPTLRSKKMCGSISWNVVQ
ncbi:hypothetical protein KUCAC02_009705, partial [Chaenocephalus aceratus]